MVYKLFLFLTALVASMSHGALEQTTARVAPWLGNAVKNPSCKYGVENITDADSIVTRNTTSALDNGTDCAVDADAIGEFPEWGVEDLSANAAYLSGQNCVAKISYSGDASLYDFEVYIGSTKVNSATMLNVSSGARQDILNFPCGDLTTDPTVRVTATDNAAAAINVARVFIGEADNIASVAQAEVVLRAVGNGATQSIPDATVTLITNWTEEVDTYSAFASGIFTANKAGEYEYKCALRWSGLSSPVRSAAVVEKNGTQVGFGQNGDVSATSNVSTGTVTLAAGDTLECNAFQDSAGASNIDGVSQAQQFSITYIPDSSRQVMDANQNAGYWQSYTPGSTISTNATITGKYQCNNGTLKGNVSILFGGTNTQGEVTIDIPSGYTIDTTKIAGGGQDNVTPFGQLSLRDAGTGVVTGFLGYRDTNTLALRYNFDSSAGANAVISGEVNTSINTPFSVASPDQFDMYYEVPVTTDSPCNWQSAPLLVDSVTTDGNNPYKIVSAVVTPASGASCTVTNESGDWIASTTPNAAGDCTLTLRTGFFSSAPVCQLTHTGTSGLANKFTQNIHTVNTTTLRVQQAFSASGVNTVSADTGPLHVMCMGPR